MNFDYYIGWFVTKLCCILQFVRSGRLFVDHLAKQFARTGFHSDQATIHTSAQASSSTTRGAKGAAAQYARRMLKDYKFPEIRTEDCDQSYLLGSGPGGQNVNKLQNAAQLRHKPTNIVVKVHESRLLQENIKLAFDALKFAVDRHLNGDACYESEFQRLERKYEKKTKRAREKRRQSKQAPGSSDDVSS